MDLDVYIYIFLKVNLALGQAFPSQIIISFCILALYKFLDLLAMISNNEIQLLYSL